MSTSEGIDENAVNCGTNRDDCERLHQCLHLIAENCERSVASVLLDAIAETLGTDAVGRVLDALEQQAEAVSRTE